MCGRFNIISDPLTRLLLEITGMDYDIDDRFNIAPTEQVPVLLKTDQGQWDLRDMRWWLIPYWAPEPGAKYSMFNARSETLEKSRAFREPFRQRRCIIPASGYYEWLTENGRKIPYYIHPRDDDGFAFAGLWDRWRGEDRVIESCTIITAVAPDTIRHIHDRIPVHLTTEQVRTWVNAEADGKPLQTLLASSLRMPIEILPVSTYVNNARNKDSRCIEPLGEAETVH